MAADTNSASYVKDSRRRNGRSATPDPIAIVGMGCRLPGGVNRPSQLWDLLCQKRTGWREFAPERINLDGYYHPNPNRPGSLHTRGANLLDEDPRFFDHRLFGLKEGEVKTLDPNQRKMLEVAYEAFESAAEPWEKFSGSRTGVFIGNFNTDYQTNQIYDVDFALPYTATGGSTSILSNRVNHVFNLRGPSVTVDTACASSMYALHLAVSAIRNGDCDAAIVGGSNLILSPEMQALTGSLGALSATSTCHTFDASADGYGRGEGFGALYLRRHADAVQGRYPIRALIRGTAINSNGKTAGISHPGVEGQEALIRQAYDSAQLLPRDTGYFECHGTGTPVGDPVEVSAIGKVFAFTRESPLLIGSVKSNLGHSESASGITGVIKCVLALENGCIPPTVGVHNLNPSIDFEAARVEVVTELTPWPENALKRASVNSFGYGGANGHCILDHPDTLGPEREDSSASSLVGESNDDRTLLNGNNRFPPTPPLAQDSLPPSCDSLSLVDYYESKYNGKIRSDSPHTHEAIINGNSALGILSEETPLEREEANTQRNSFLLPFSGQDESATRSNMLALMSVIDQYSLTDIAYTLSRRSKFLFKSFCIADSPTAYLPDQAVIRQSTSSQTPRLGFVFTGQGAQWQEMGRSLFAFTVFRSSISAQDDVLRTLSCKPPWSIAGILSGTTDHSVQDAEISQTICTALQVALVDLLQSWNIAPHAVVGHSSGEIAAAYAAGYISRAETIVTAYYRGIALSTNNNEGAMMAVGMSADECRSVLAGKEESVKIAAVNSPSSVTLSGDKLAMQELYEQLQAESKFSRLLKTGGNAYHSHHMKAVGEHYELLLAQALEEVRKRDPESLLVQFDQQHWTSSVTPWKKMERHLITPSYWRQNLESPVQFSQAVSNLTTNSTTAVDILIEIGPHSALQGPLNQIVTAVEFPTSSKPPSYLPSLKRFNNGERNLLELCGNLFCNSYPVDLITLNAGERLVNGKVEYDIGSVCPNLPTYQYTYGPIICHETRIAREIRQRKFLRHDLLGSLQPGCARDRPAWRNVLRLKDLPWLSDHKLLPHPVLPGSAYVCIAIEAMSQYLTGKPELSSEHCFKLRNVSIKSAMRIPEDDTGLEIVLNLHPSSGNPSFYEFNLASVSEDGATWTEHASGLVSISASTKAPLRRLDEGINPRFIDTQEWYTHFTEAGLGYGPSFSALHDLTSDPYKDIASAKIGLHTTRPYFPQGPESPYAIHPASLDLCHQLALIACHGGQTGRFRTAFIPVSIDEVTVWPALTTHEDEWGHGIAAGRLKGLRGAHADVQLFTQSGHPIIEMQNLKCVAHHGGKGIMHRPDVHEYTRLAWKPDISSLSNSQARTLFPPPVPRVAVENVFRKMDELAMYMVVELDVRFAASAPCTPHLQRFLRWVSKVATGDVPFADTVRSMSSSERHAAIDAIGAALPDVIDVHFARRIFDNMERILNGTTTGVEVALQGDIVNKVYTTGLGISAAYPQLARLLDLFAHRDPSISILEVGAGTGAATDVAMSILAPKGSPKRYASYTFTDVSTAFLTAAQAKFSRCKNMEFRTYDMNVEPDVQGMSTTYDVIIASECVHATANTHDALNNLRALLKPEGKLVLLETTRALLGHNIVYGTFPDWWDGDEERDSPFLTGAEWHLALQRSGFSGIDIELSDYEEPHGIVSTIVSTAVESGIDSEKAPSPPKVHIITLGEPGTPHEAIGDELRRQNLSPIFQQLKNDVPPSSRVLLCLTHTNYSLADATEEEFTQLRAIIRNASSILWLVIGDSLRGSLPRSATTTGLVRMLTTEMPEARHGIFLLEQPLEHTDAALITEIVARETRLHAHDFDREIAVKDGIAHISRLVFDAELNAQYRDLHIVDHEPALAPIHGHGPVVAHFSKPGLISSLLFRRDEAAFEPLPDDYIEVRTAAVGLNWKDLALCTGRNDMDHFSSECAGTVVGCGRNVQHLNIGDRIYAIAWGKFGNTLRLPAKMAQGMQPGDRFEDMAAVPLAFCTAHYGLSHLARLQRKERVLIQGATGGVGLAAIQIAKHFDAEVYATAGRQDKIDFLVEQCGIERARIFSSRDERDLQRVQSVTDGHGFDVILSTSTGSMMHESWRHLAPRGRFIDVGRLDVQNGATLAMEVFRRNAVYASFDLSIMASQDLDFCATLMDEVGSMMRRGEIRPIPQLRTFDISELESALLYFSQGKHIGKIAVTYTNEQSLVKMIRPRPSARFDPDSLYVLVGGLGGFGRGILEWMVARGARNLAVWSRSGKAPPEAKALISQLNLRNVKVDIVRCDVTDKSSIDTAIAQAPIPIKGIIHAAVTFCDQAFEILPYSQWQLGISAKVTGTENLHEATIKHSLGLDFFVMTSSYEAVVALPTQAAYCAANSFQDAFARYRRAMGLPACAIALGLITEIGEVGQRDITTMMIDRNNLYGTGELGTLRLLEAAFLEAPVPVQDSRAASCHWRDFDPLAAAQITTCLEPYKLALRLTKNGTDRGVPRWMTDKKFSHIVQATEDLKTGANEPTQDKPTVPEVADAVGMALDDGRVDDAQALVLAATKERVASLLRIPVESIEGKKSVAEYGVDSLIAVELRSWLLATFQSAIPLLRLLDESIPMAELAEWIVREILERKGASKGEL